MREPENIAYDCPTVSVADYETLHSLSGKKKTPKTDILVFTALR